MVVGRVKASIRCIRIGTASIYEESAHEQWNGQNDNQGN